MKKLSKAEAKGYIYETFEFIDSGVVEWGDNVFYGHPGLYFFHSKKDLENKIECSLNKEQYDKYDLYYIVNMLIKYMFGKYDSHTKAWFDNGLFLPIKFKIQDDKVYIINNSPDLDDFRGATLISVNDIEISKILGELEEIISYSTIEYLNTNQEFSLCNFEVLKSLPSINNDLDSITFKVMQDNEIKEINFNSSNLPRWFKVHKIKNYSYEILDDCIVIHYNACHCDNDGQMLNLIENIRILSQEKNINNYIVDLRDNCGGDSRIIKPLVEYLEDKNIVVLVNETVFSSGRMAYVDLKKIGAHSIGTDISTSLNCFGNVPGELKLDDLNLSIVRSSTYWFYDENFECTGYEKDSFTEYFSKRKELLEPTILHPDEYVYLTISDIINGNDPQMNAAVDYFNQCKRKS